MADIIDLMNENTKLKEALKKVKPFIEEMWAEHRDKNSFGYNQCEIDPCMWCEETNKIFEGLK